MALPDPHENENTVEIPQAVWAAYIAARNNAEAWGEQAARYRSQIEELMGSAPAGTVDGVKVVTYRPSARFAEFGIKRDYPELVQHFVREKVVEEFDVKAFVAAHPDLAEKYRSRSFRVSE